MAIRTRILLVVVALVFVALTVLDVVSYTVVRRSLISTADTQLTSATPRFKGALTAFAGGGGCYGLPVNSFGTLYYLNGDAAATVTCPSPSTRSPISHLPASVISLATHSTSPVSATVPASGSVKSYRILEQMATAIPNRPGAHKVSVVFVVGEPLTSVDSTLGSVLILEILVTSSILIAVGAAAFFLVELGLRPLEDMSVTAGEIAAGDLSRRVEDADERTEVGRLGSSLNVMLSRIEQAFRAKEASEEQLRRFVADASHELRTPLTSIRGYAELFRDGRVPRPEDLSVALRRIESESARMSGLVEDLLLLARLDQGRPLDKAPVDVAALAEDAVRDARVLAPDREVTLRTAGEVVAIGDQERLHQVVANLVANALSHTPPESPIETVVEDAGDWVRLRVVDHGPGISEPERAKVFDRFWRADESRHRTKGGSGLGLSIVEAVVAAHGGRVSVADTPGGGATFTVDLPSAAGAGSDEDAEPAAGTPPEREPSWTGLERVPASRPE